MAGVLADEHVPGPSIAVLRSLGHGVVRAKDELAEGSNDERLLDHAHGVDRIVVTCDRRFAVVVGTGTDDHSGVIYAEQTMLQTRPEDAASAVDRIVSTVPLAEMAGSEFYRRGWL